ncbi:MAG: matrixin family metalloprotease, partial [Gemmataceae bacterium]|nr:matrixin family metalloprotease [Gemmataceae bacterium]
MKRFKRLSLETLEHRELPATFGIPWADPNRITVSFAPSGTPIGQSTSSLETLLGPNQTEWQTEILRAFQTWAVHVNINFGLVRDEGLSFMSGGAFQGDLRFGDIRIGAARLSSDVYANTAPPNTFSAMAGNVVLNTSKGINIGGTGGKADLFTIMLHEAGHALGIANSPNKTSVMYESYAGQRKGLAAEDIASLQQLYGVRSADPFDRTAANDTRQTASALPFYGIGSLGVFGAAGDITTMSDVDWYQFTPVAANMSVRLRTNGVSLLTAQVRIVDAQGREIAAARSANPLNGDLSLSLTNLDTRSKYFISVAAERTDVFAIGAYQLAVATDAVFSTVNYAANLDYLSFTPPENHTNNTISTATPLLSLSSSVNARVDALVVGKLLDSTDVDFYSITAPASSSSAPLVLAVSVWGTEGRVINPTMEV